MLKEINFDGLKNALQNQCLYENIRNIYVDVNYECEYNKRYFLGSCEILDGNEYTEYNFKVNKNNLKYIKNTLKELTY